MQPILIVLILILATAVGGAVYVILVNRQRRLILDRTAGVAGGSATISIGRKEGSPFLAGVQRIAPAAWTNSAKITDKLVQAGYDTDSAPLTFASLRVAALVILPLAFWVLFPKYFINRPVIALPGSLFVAWILPLALLDRKVRERQDRIRKTIPDALDLLIVCVESGSSLDASLLRVAREMRSSAEDLSSELLVINRKTNAGMPREEALRGLATRTGLPELRALVSSMIQSEKWGTSISQVLRVNAENFRRKRRQAAEKRAQQAPVKMIIPLVMFILPALFLVILGPASIQIAKLFSSGR